MDKKVVNIKQNTNDIVQSLKTQLWLKYRTIIKGKRGTHGVKIIYSLSTTWEDNEESNQVNADKKNVWVLIRKVPGGLEMVACACVPAAQEPRSSRYL